MFDWRYYLTRVGVVGLGCEAGCWVGVLQYL